MSIAVVIPCYNSATYVADTLDSVLSQTVPPAEIVVVNDGSTDNTAEVLARFRPHVHILERSNQGAGLSRNAGVQACASPWIAFLDADDLYEPTYIESILRAISNAPKTDLFFADYSEFTGDVTTLSSSLRHHVPNLAEYASWHQDDLLVFGTELLAPFIRKSGAFAISTLTIRRRLFDEVGQFVRMPQGADDLDLYLRVLPRVPVGIIHRVLLRKRQHPSSLGRISDLMYSSVETALERAEVLYREHYPQHLAKIRQKRRAVWLDRGRALMFAGAHSNARQLFWRAIKAAPFDAEGWRCLAEATFRIVSGRTRSHQNQLLPQASVQTTAPEASTTTGV